MNTPFEHRLLSVTKWLALIVIGLASESLAAEPDLKSSGAGRFFKFRFVNRLNQTVDAYWLDYKGKPRKETSIGKGKGWNKTARTSHVFVFKTRDGSFSRVVRPRKGGGEMWITRHEERNMRGWRVHVNLDMEKADPAKMSAALRIIDQQLESVVKAVPKTAVAKLRSIPIWINPTPRARGPRAEYHRNPSWLKSNRRNPGMALAVEITMLDIIAQETKRMPFWMLHELTHGYQDQNRTAFDRKLKEAFDRARRSGKYNRVKRYTGQNYVYDRSYAMSDPSEYFAESIEAFFGRNDFYPFNHSELKQHDPEMFRLVADLWGVPVGK